MIKKHPHLVVALILLLLVLLFTGRVLFPAAGFALGAHDTRGLFIPWWQLTRTAVTQGQIPWWDDQLFAGYPFLANPQVAFFYPFTWLAILPPVETGLSWYVAFHLWLAGLGMYLFVTQLTPATPSSSSFIPYPSSFIAAVLFMFSGFFTARIYAGHVGLIAVHAWTPWLLWASWRMVQPSAGIPAAVLAGVPLGLAILAGHTTSLLYVGLLWLCFCGALPWLLPGRFTLLLRQMIIAGVVAVLLSAVQWLPLLQLSLVAGRTAEANYEFATGYSFPPAHLITLLIPQFFGEPIRAGYWSVPNFEELTAYAGLLPLLILPLALAYPQKQSWLWLGLMGLGVLLALGSYGFLYPLVYTYIPLFRLARAPGRALFLYTFSASVLTGVTLATAPRPGWLKWVAAGGVWVGLTALAATGAVFASQHPTETSGRLWHQLGGWGIATLLWGSGATILYMAHKPEWQKWANGLLLALVIVDSWLLGWSLVRVEPTAPAGFWAEAKAIIGETESRVLPWGISIFDQNGAQSAGLASVFGYNALEIGANLALVSSVPDPRSSAYDLFATQYVIATAPQDPFIEGERGLRLVGQNGSAWVYERPRFFPLVRLVYGVELIPDREQAIARIHQIELNPAEKAIVAQEPECDLQLGGSGTAKITGRAAGWWQIETQSDRPALLVVSETAYPGWQVTIDGQPAAWLTAYTALRAVCVPAGVHLVEWQFRPTIFMWGGLLSALALVWVGWAVRRLY